MHLYFMVPEQLLNLKFTIQILKKVFLSYLEANVFLTEVYLILSSKNA